MAYLPGYEPTSLRKHAPSKESSLRDLARDMVKAEYRKLYFEMFRFFHADRRDTVKLSMFSGVSNSSNPKIPPAFARYLKEDSAQISCINVYPGSPIKKTIHGTNEKILDSDDWSVDPNYVLDLFEIWINQI